MIGKNISRKSFCVLLAATKKRPPGVEAQAAEGQRIRLFQLTS